MYNVCCLRTLHCKHICSATFLDLCKAFVILSHPHVINKLASYGIKGTALQLITRFFPGRTQRIKLNDTVVTILSIEYGVPPGTISGPTRGY